MRRRTSKITKVGSTSGNFHEGNRSEYLAQYVLTSFGTAVQIPRPEDTGLDFFCTLTERIGRRIWPRHYYSVQVKSSLDPWILAGKKSVKWLVEHPVPLFLCVVDKRVARLRFYQTSPRFAAWAFPHHLQRLQLNPEDLSDGKPLLWKGGSGYSLSAPILDFTIDQTLQDGFLNHMKEVLEFWITLEEKNLYRLKAGILSFTVPLKYSTNSTTIPAWGTLGATSAVPKHLKAAIGPNLELLGWLAGSLHLARDKKGALRAALLCQYLCREYGGQNTLGYAQSLLMEINRLQGNGEELEQGLDELQKKLDQSCAFKKHSATG